MNPEHSAYQISFILSGHRYQKNVRMDQERADSLFKCLDAGRTRLTQSGSVSSAYIQDIQVYQLSPEDQAMGSALDFLETITNAVGIQDPSNETDYAGIQNLLKQAQALEAGTEGVPEGELEAVIVDFTWDNGGMDDNAFSDGFDVAPGQQKEKNAFLDNLIQWLDTHGLAYDVTSGSKISHDDALDLLDGLSDLISTIQDNQTDYVWINVLETAADEETARRRADQALAHPKTPAQRRSQRARP